MALQGTIESFGVCEILELVSHQSKTGVLHIQSSEGTARIKFKNGKLVEAWSDKRKPAELIGELLVRSGLITVAQLQHSIETQRQSLRRIGDILISTGAVRVSEFKEILELQHKECVYRLLKLKRGGFRFVPGPVEVEHGVGVLMDVGSLLMEGFRQIDEWPGLLKKIPSEKQIFALNVDSPAGPPMPPEMARVLSLVDGTATVREIVDRSRLGEFNGWEAMCSLFDLGLITPIRAAGWKRKAPAIKTKGKTLDLLTALALLVLAAVIVNAFNGNLFEATVDGLKNAAVEAKLEAEALRRRAAQWRQRVPADWSEVDENGR